MKLVPIYFFLLIFFSQTVFANINKPEQKFSGCNNLVSEQFQKKFNSLKIDKIEIDVHNYRNWIVNTESSRFDDVMTACVEENIFTAERVAEFKRGVIPISPMEYLDGV